MKPEYQHMKLIIECPTLDAWNKITKFFELEWGHLVNAWPYQQQTYIRVGIWGRQQDSCGYGIQFTYSDFKDWEHLTYHEFEARFLNKNDMNIENIITKAVEGLEQAASTLSKVQEMLKNRPEPELEKKVWTVEEVQKDVKPKWVFFYDGKICESRFGNYLGSCPTEKAAKQELAFCQLLTVAHWANGGEPHKVDGEVIQYVPMYVAAQKQFDMRQVIYVYDSPIILKSIESYNKFLSVHGVEDLLKTFFGIEE